LLYPGQAEGYYADFGSSRQLAKAIEHTFVYDGIFSRYRKRAHGRAPRNLSQHRFLGYIQNHDQIGNRAIGERLHESVGFDRAKVAAAIVLLSPFVPMIFEGEEWAASSPFQYFADHEDPQLARAVSEGRRKEFEAFGWAPESIPDPEKRETYMRSKLKWDEAGEEKHAEMLAWYRELIRLRRSTPSLNCGEPGNAQVTFDETERWLTLNRDEIQLHCNLGTLDHPFATPSGSSLLLASRLGIEIRDSVVLVPSDSAAIVRVANGVGNPRNRTEL
jgi:maltooligosyltrehalose trehalohydrolase